MLKSLFHALRQRQLSRPRRDDREAGYSMMEILIVLAIMAVIATLVGPSLFNQLDKSKVTTARTQIRTLEAALATMRLEIGRFPTESEGLLLLSSRPKTRRPAGSGMARTWMTMCRRTLGGDLIGTPFLKPGSRGIRSSRSSTRSGRTIARAGRDWTPISDGLKISTCQPQADRDQTVSQRASQGSKREV
jgi:type II secretion system protein G